MSPYMTERILGPGRTALELYSFTLNGSGPVVSSFRARTYGSDSELLSHMYYARVPHSQLLRTWRSGTGAAQTRGFERFKCIQIASSLIPSIKHDTSHQEPAYIGKERIHTSSLAIQVARVQKAARDKARELGREIFFINIFRKRARVDQDKVRTTSFP